MNNSRFVAAGMALVLIIMTGWPAHAFFEDISHSPYQEAIEEVASLGILKGYGDGSFGPDESLNRAQAAKVAGYLMGFTDADAQAASGWEPLFPDVHPGMGANEWAVGWINLVAQEDVIRGYAEDGGYHPERTLEMVQWGAILMRILGHETEGMAWPADYDRRFQELGLDDGIPYRGPSRVTREQMAQTAFTAIYRVADAGGQFLTDRIEFPGPVQEVEEDPAFESEGLTLSIQGFPGLLPTGGGEEAVITAWVKKDGAPVAGAEVYFMAEAEGQLRIDQLSAAQARTDDSGRASTTYTTLPGDDGKRVEIGCTVFVDGDEMSEATALFVSDNAAEVTGLVKNPYSGVPVAGAEVNLFDSVTHKSHVFMTDDGGAYTAYVPAGAYTIFYRFSMDETPGYDHGDYGGSNYGIEEGQFRLQHSLDLAGGQRVRSDCDPGMLKGTLARAEEGMKMALVRISNNETVLADINADGTFAAPLAGGDYDVFIMGESTPLTRVSITPGSVADLGDID